ncbi:hypothetical protein RJ640_000605 [Escallonia rubra]|uniref:Uncharacterized protein n=1 Tax=Escallonia rubra TaxID=112253 RepID=A0AA88UEB5_9ASTE|nr:hypothetical protein RJ640_000605 [Escallonia rubra]
MVSEPLKSMICLLVTLSASMNMTDNSSSIASAPARSDDPAWAHDDDIEDIVVSAGSVGNAEKKKGREVVVASKRKNVSSFFAPRTTPGSQPSIKSAMATKEMIDNAKLAYDANVPFNGAHSKYYQPMFDVALDVGPGFKAPSFHDLRGNLLRTLHVVKLSEPLVRVLRLTDGDEKPSMGYFYGHVVKLSEPLVRVLRLTDGDEKPSMGYLYEAIDKANETIKSNLKNRLSLYMPPSFKKQKEVTRGLLSTITTLVPDDYMQDLISSQLEEYKQGTCDFCMPIVVRQREKLNPNNDGGWNVLQLEPAAVNLEDEEVHYKDAEDALHGIPSQYDWEFGGEGDHYHYIE